MPAAAGIPAPIAYIKVVAVKKLVVGFLVGEVWSAPLLGCEYRSPLRHPLAPCAWVRFVPRPARSNGRHRLL